MLNFLEIVVKSSMKDVPLATVSSLVLMTRAITKD
jgi:hypothetical protein